MVISATILLVLCSCHHDGHRHTSVVTIIQPLGDFPLSQAGAVYMNLRKISLKTILKEPISLPATAYYKPRNRYRADSLISYLNHSVTGDTVIIGLTAKDISTTKDEYSDWGVMGLGYCPGNACVVSTFRLSRANQASQFYKVAAHELGHTQGLPHCKDKTCFMRDAEGGNHLDEEMGFCPSCKSYLRNKGWRLN